VLRSVVKIEAQGVRRDDLETLNAINGMKHFLSLQRRNRQQNSFKLKLCAYAFVINRLNGALPTES
jgi:hypothetical protein